MALTNHSGPIMAGTLSLGRSGDSNPTPGPSAATHGWGLLDQRYSQWGGDGIITQWYATNDIMVCDQAPATLGTAKLVALAAPVVNTAMTLAVASTGITVVAAGGFSIAPGYPTVPAGCLCIDGLPALIQLAPGGGGVSMLDPRTAVARALTVTSTGVDTGGTMVLKGYDYYGQPMTQSLTMGSGAAVTTTKAFKFLQSATVTVAGSGNTVSVGTSDVYGFALATYEFFNTNIWWGTPPALITVPTNWTAAVTTTPSATTGDVRGTYATQSASDGTKKLQLSVSPQPWNLTAAGMFGATQF